MLIIKANALTLTCDRCHRCDRCLQPLTTSLLVSTLQPAGSEMCAELFWPARFPSLFLLSQTGTHCPLSLVFSHLLSNTIYWPYGHFLYEIFDFSHTVMPSCFSAFKKAVSSFIHTSYLPHEWLSENTAYVTSKNLALQSPFSQHLVTDSLQFSCHNTCSLTPANLQEPSASCPKIPSALLLTTAMYSF